MRRHGLLLVFLVLGTLSSFTAAAQQAPTQALSRPAPATPAPGVAGNPSALTAPDARRALDVLQDDNKRADLIATLRAIADTADQSHAPASPSQAPAKPAASASSTTSDAVASGKTAAATTTVAANGLGAQLLLETSEQLGELSHTLISSVRTITDFPLLWNWLQRIIESPFARQMLLETGWKLIVVLAGALAAEWAVRWLLRRPLSGLATRVPVSAPPLTDNPALNSEPAAARSQTTTPGRQRRYLDRSWRYLIRLPFVTTHFILELLPIAICEIVGVLLLSSGLGDTATPRLVILAILNAYVLTRTVLCVARALASAGPLSVARIPATAAHYFETWVGRITTLTVFGITFANIALLLGLYRPGYEALVKLVMLVVHVLVVVVIIECRKTVAALLRPRGDSRGVIAAVRNRFASTWHYLAALVVMALWAVWAFDIQDGYALLLRYFIGSMIVVALARFAAMLAIGMVDRLYRSNAEKLSGDSALGPRATRYLPLLNATVSAVIAASALVALLEVWGVDAVLWLYRGQIGGRLISAIITVGATCIAALAVWEASNAVVERHLARLVRELQFARAARLRTFLPMLRTALFCVVVAVVGVTALSEIGVNVAPLLAGAGIIGIAIGFGSQKLVQDVITGLFLLIENVVQVGDFVTVSGLSGTVENLSIRTIRLRAGDGSVHVIPFSSVTSITNTNRGIGNAAVNVSVPFDEDIDRVYGTLRDIGAEMRQDPTYRGLIRGDLDLWGVDKVDGYMVTIIGQIVCTDAGRWPVQREFNRRMRQRFQQAGIKIAAPAPTQTVVVTLSSAPDPAQRTKSAPSARPDTEAYAGP